MNRVIVQKIIFLAFMVLIFASLYFSDTKEYLSLSFLKSNYQVLQIYFKDHELLFNIVFFVFYVLVTAFSIPGAVVLTLGTGAIFGFWYGLLIVSFASTLGATFAFIFSRYILKDFIQGHFTKELKKINKGIINDGAFYLFFLRLIPAFPFFIINLVMGVTPIKTFTYIWVSQAGMLAGTMVYVNAGLELSKLNAITEIMNLRFIGAFILLALFPVLVKLIIKKYHRDTSR